jgi:hypothetical protein
MDNQELFSQVHSLIKEQTAVISSYIDHRIGETERRLYLKVEKIEAEIAEFWVKPLALKNKTA